MRPLGLTVGLRISGSQYLNQQRQYQGRPDFEWSMSISLAPSHETDHRTDHQQYQTFWLWHSSRIRRTSRPSVVAKVTHPEGVILLIDHTAVGRVAIGQS